MMYNQKIIIAGALIIIVGFLGFTIYKSNKINNEVFDFPPIYNVTPTSPAQTNPPQNSNPTTPNPKPTPAPVPAPKPVTSGNCYVGGCSGQICSADKYAVSTCEYRAEYACYKSATCERQASGQCGWTQTSALQKCLSDNSGLTHGPVVPL